MNETRILAVALRIMGVWTLIGLIQAIGQGWAFGMISQVDGQSLMSRVGWVLAVTIPIALSAGISYALLRYPDFIAAKLMPRGDSANLGSINDYERLFELALRIIGVVLLVWIIPPNVVRIAVNFSAHTITGADVETVAGGWNLIIRTVVQIIAGAYLIRGAPGLVRWSKSGITNS